ncbi:MAG TPA: phenylalanine--tRNA ligase subunit beta [Candidatus Macondimonas sp.]|nr:phenylalanine--tRNA ligase subunit beta [Candidatus Macondimonas sp.]
MRLADDWLKEWIRPVPPVAELAHRLTMGGLEVDGIEPAAPAFQGVVVGRIVGIAPHPQADRLRVCEVDAGAAERLQIVCGAANAAVGLRVPLAQVGAKLPDGLEIKPARLRGVASFGMLCSAKELGLAETSEGLLELPDDAPVGQDVRICLSLDGHVLEVDLTPNRGDCLSVRGIAREVAALTGAELTKPSWDAVPAAASTTLDVAVRETEACPVYLGRVIEGFDAGARTPMWMRERLRRAGLRSLGPVVDVTNYVLLELGQPLHAFDLDRIGGGLAVRWAQRGERLTLLTGQDIALNADELVIADEQGPVALAGIMGGRRSAVDAATRRVFLECAFFAPHVIAGRARRHGMQTDAAQRYERGVDPTQQREALERATALLLQIAGGVAGPVVSAAESAFEAPEIVLRHARLVRVLGGDFPAQEAESLLTRLHTKWKRTEEGWVVRPPAHRFDLRIEADLIEDLIRLRGYEALEARRPVMALRPVVAPETAISPARVAGLLVERGYHETITYSFVDPALQAPFLAEAVPVDLINPIASDLSQMRTSLWPGLIRALQANLKRQAERVRLFEIGAVFARDLTGIRQQNRLAGLIHGPSLPEQWRGGRSDASADFFEVKGDLEALAVMMQLPPLQALTGTHPALHPGKTARLTLAGSPIGWLGELHPGIGARLDLPQGVIVFEWDMDATPVPTLPRFSPLSRFPSVRRDLAVVVPEATPVGDLAKLIRAVGGARLKDCLVFDVYRGPGVEQDRKSVAFGLIFQDDDCTLEDKVVDEAVDTIIRHLADRAGARVRE